MPFAAGCKNRRQTSTIHPNSPSIRGLFAACTLATLVLAGCGSSARLLTSADAATSLTGSVHSAGQPVGNAQIQLYAAGDGNGSANAPLLKQPVHTDASGSFKVQEALACPSPSSQLYLVATGGAISARHTSSNSAATLVSALGACSDVSASTALDVNELTTAASVAALAPFMSSLTTVGASAKDQQALRDAFTSAADLADTLQQANADPTLPQAQLTSIQKLATLADILSACTITTGGAAGDGSPCGSLFSYARSAQANAPQDTASALLDIVANPTHNVASIYSLHPAAATFQPSLPSAPQDWSIVVEAAPPQPLFSPAPGTYTGTQTITLTDAAPGARIFYQIDGTWLPYTGPFLLPSSKSIQTMALSSVASHAVTATYAISTPKITVTAPTVIATGQSGTATVTLATPAPTGGVTVALSSSASSIATITPATIKIAQGESSASFSYKAVHAGAITLTASATGFSTVSTQLTVATPKLVFLNQPSNAPAGSILSLPPSVAVEDSTGAVITSASYPVTLALSANTFGGVLGGVTSANTVNGVASFSGVTIPAPGVAYTLVASAAGLASVTSNAFNNTGFIMLIPVATTLTAGQSSSGFFTLNQPAAPGGTVVTLTSSNPAVTTISPATVTVPRGQSSGNFTYKNLTSGTVTLSGAATGYTAGTVQIATSGVTLSMTPLTVSLAAAQKQQFTPAVTGSTNTAVTWSLSPAVGTISSAGLYTAPATVTSAQAVTVTATSVADSSKRVTATVNLTAAPASIAVSSTGTLVAASQSQQLSATITGLSTSAVTWSLNPTIGSISASGAYTAPSIVTPGQIVTVTATSVADVTKKASTALALTSTVGVTLSPGTATVVGGQTQQFSSGVTGTRNIDLIWSISPALGSITQYGQYTAPANFIPGQVVSVVATSVADPSRSAWVPVSLVTAPASSSAVNVTLTPGTATVAAGGTQQFSSGVTGTYNTGLVWSISPALGSITQYGQYTAPTSFVPGQVVNVVATSVADPSRSAYSPVTLTEAAFTLAPASSSGIGVTMTPASVSLYASQIQQYSVSVSGTRNTGVTFSVSPAVGSVSQVGLYTAPASITSAQTVSVIATSNSDGFSRAVSTVSLIPPVTFAATDTIPANFFGMSVFNFQNTVPPVSFGTTRSWDSYPDVSWAATNSAPGVYNFAPIDSFIATNQARGADMIYTLGRTPQWASFAPYQGGNYGPGQCAAPANMANYDAYVTALATHVAGKIKYWELWNEADDPNYYCGDIYSMVVMAQHASRIIKSIDPSAKILSPGITGGPGPLWLAGFLALGGGNSVDIIGFHGYATAKAEDFVGIVSGYRAVMALGGAGSKPMWDTESSWAGTGSIGTPDSPSQVAFVAKDYLLHWSQGISRFVWYAYDGGTVWGGLLTPYNTPSAAVTSYAQTQRWMVGASLSTPCSQDLFSQIWTCGLTRANGYQAEAIWLTGASRNVTVPSQYVEYRDLAGNVVPISNHTVTIGDQPLLLESAPLQ